ncbi:carboxymuconolactone decarboxylase family protein [Peptococcaceae bacterium 1198_IL3148]
MSTDLIAVLNQLQAEKPEVAQAIGNLRTTVINNSTLDEKTNGLVALGISVATKDPSALVGHIKLAQQAGASKDEVVSCILLATPAIGVPATLTALATAWDIYK